MQHCLQSKSLDIRGCYHTNMIQKLKENVVQIFGEGVKFIVKFILIEKLCHLINKQRWYIGANSEIWRQVCHIWLKSSDNIFLLLLELKVFKGTMTIHSMVNFATTLSLWEGELRICQKVHIRTFLRLSN